MDQKKKSMDEKDGGGEMRMDEEMEEEKGRERWGGVGQNLQIEKGFDPIFSDAQQIATKYNANYK